MLLLLLLLCNSGLVRWRAFILPVDGSSDTTPGLIAYDCAADNHNITAVSLYRPASCVLASSSKITIPVSIQVIQQKTSQLVWNISASKVWNIKANATTRGEIIIAGSVEGNDCEILV